MYVGKYMLRRLLLLHGDDDKEHTHIYLMAFFIVFAIRRCVLSATSC